MKKNWKKEDNADDKSKLPESMKYTSDQDIYNKEKKEQFNDDLQPDQHPLHKSQHLPEDELDLPGAELDDEQEILGEEDEENNYYSLGGDNHNNLDENE